MPLSGTGLPPSVDRVYHLDLGNDCPVHVAAAVLAADKRGKRRVVSGRGLSGAEAEQRCLFEATERHSAVFDDMREFIAASARELTGATVDPRQLLQISQTQYLTMPAWNAAVEADHHLPAPFDDERRIAWVEAVSLTSKTTKLVPAAACFLGYPKALEEGFPVPDSSGLASGNSVSDATERALLELVERDAVSIWWYNRLPRPALLFDQTMLSSWQGFSDWMARCGRRFWLLDLSTDLSAPVAAAVSCEQNGTDLSLGFAAAATAEAAAEQALGELVQFEATKRNFTQASAGTYPHLVSWCRSVNIADHPFLRPGNEPAPKSSRPRCSTDTILAALHKAELDAFTVDLSPTGEKEKSVRVIAPGLRSIWPRYAPGRLYDVPFQLGWLPTTHQESELNPFPMLY